jgi:hypothetical protein
MISRKILSRKRKIRHPDEESTRPRPAKAATDRFGLMTLQRQVGNQAIQQMIAQRQAEQKSDTDNEQAAKALVALGQVKIEKPEVKEYEVTGETLQQVSGQVLAPEKWYEYEYQYNPKVENGVVTEVEVIVLITIHVPHWVGPGWERAANAEKLAWLKLLETLGVGEDEYEDVTELPKQWVGVDFSQAPEDVKGEWQKMLLEFQKNEKTPLDIARRRVLVLQQRLLTQPENQVKEIFAKFEEDVKEEEVAYNEQRELGQLQLVTLEPDVLVH